MASRFVEVFRSLPPSFRRKQIGPSTGSYRLRVCGSEDIIQSLKNIFKARFQDQADSLETINMGKIQSMTAGWCPLSVSKNDAFILFFYLDDEDSFQALSAFRDVITSVTQDEDITLLVVGYSRDTSAPYNMDSEAVKRQVTLNWGHDYSEASAECPEDLDLVLQRVFKIICDKQAVATRIEQKTTTM